MRPFLLVALLGCSGPPTEVPPADAPPIEPVEGGRIATRCGYDVVTPYGVTAPERATDVIGPDPAPHQIHLGIAGDPATSMVVTWRTRDDTTRAGRVDYGRDALDQHAEALTWLYYPYGSGPVRIHEAHLCGLEPDTDYRYRLSGSEAVHRFRTAPAGDASAEVTIGVVGDTREGWDVFGELLAALDAEHAPDLILFTGDAVDKGLDQLEWNRFLEAGGEILKRVPIVMVTGNHEGNDPVFYAQFAMPGGEQDFRLDYGPVRIVALNDSPSDLTELGARIASFLDAELAAAGDRWKIVAHHRPIWSAALFHGSAEELRAAWGPILDAHQVPLVVSGHDHGYERTHPMVGEARATSRGTTYLVSGGAGADLYDSGSDFWTALSESVHHYVVLRVRPGRLEVTATRLDGSILDELVLTEP